MSKKDYIKIAKIIEDNTLEGNGLMLPSINKVKLVSELSVMFKRDNELFNKGKFIDACYGGDELNNKIHYIEQLVDIYFIIYYGKEAHVVSGLFYFFNIS